MTLVPAVDADGNDRAGIRLPDIEVPLGTYAGWNLRAAAWGAEGMLTRWMGSYWPFAQTKADRERAGDPRPSIEERYPTKAEYLARVRVAGRNLERQGFLLKEDADAILRRAEAADLWKN